MEKKDDYFKDYYKDLYGTVTQAQTDALTNGSGTAAGRETTRLSFKTLLGSGDAANDFVNKIQTIANVTPFEFGDLTAISKSLLAYHYSADDVLKTLNDIGEAGSALGMLVYNRIAALLQDIPGVQDFSSLTVNGGTANIAIADNQVPVMGTVVIS